MARVPTLTELLNDFLVGRGEHGKPMSTRAAARQIGDDNKYETFRLISKGQHSGNISEDVVAALVRLGLNERDVRRAAGHQLEKSPGPFVAPERWARLTPAQRDVVLSVGDTILAAAAAGERRPPLRAVASGQRSPAAASEAAEKAARRRKQMEGK